MSFIETFKNEFRLIFTDIAIVLTIIGGVLLYAFLYPQPYAQKSVSELSVSVVDLDRSELSRSLIFKLNSTPQVNVTEVVGSEYDAKKALLEGKSKAIVVIPSHFKRDLALHKQPVVAVGADASYFLIYGGVLEASLKSILTQSALVKVATLLKDGVPLSGAQREFSAYSLNAINLFNKQNSYTQYVIPAVFVLILQQTLLIGLGILGGGVNERRKDKDEDTNTLFVMISRLVIFGTIFLTHMLFYFGFSFEFFGITHLASIENLLTFGSMFLLAVIFLGMFLGSLLSSREIATPLVLFSSLALVFSAGFVWPVEALPTWLYILANLSPSTPAIEGFLILNQMGGEFASVRVEFGILTLQVLVYAILGYYFINKNKRKSSE